MEAAGYFEMLMSTKLHGIIPQNTITFKQQMADVHKVKCDIIYLYI